MREPSVRDVQKDEILQKCFRYLVDTGLEKVTTRSLSKETGMSMSSIYYWFGDIDTLILDSTKFGLQFIVDALFTFILSNFKDVNQLIMDFPDEIIKYSNELQFIYQVTTSPHYGAEMKKISIYLSEVYDKYAEILNDQLPFKKDDFKMYAYLFKNSITNYIIWEDGVRTRKELEFICRQVFNEGEI